jgi:hypothetical protein
VAMTADASPASRRTIDWSSITAAARELTDSTRTVVGESWRRRMRQEHLAVGGFAQLTLELAAVGCSSAVLGLVARASADEVRHVELCRQFAVALLGEQAVPRGWRGVPSLPPHAGHDAATRALFHLVEVCCLSETMTGVYFTEMRARASHPAARAAIDSLLEDEIDHGKVGWAYLAERARGGSLGDLPEALAEMIERTFGEALRRLQIVDDPRAEKYGYLPGEASTQAVRRALAEVVVPGFEALAIPLGHARPTIDRLLV